VPPFLNPAVLKHIRSFATPSATLWGLHCHSCSYFLNGRTYGKKQYFISNVVTSCLRILYGTFYSR